ncbi:Asch domain superfamily [Bacillus cereus Rock3-44]|nr:Asch domain superfamily [Bacillus cereus Rock3-44]
MNSADEPVAIIKTIEVTLTPMNEVSEEFAIAEGEGDRTYEYWKNVHIEFFTKELKRIDRKFSEDMLLVCERFELIDVKE